MPYTSWILEQNILHLLGSENAANVDQPKVRVTSIAASLQIGVQKGFSLTIVFTWSVSGAASCVLHFFVEVISHTCSPGRGEILVRSQGTQPDGESSKSGHFFSPNWPKTFEPGRRCVYRFIAASGEKVHLRFQHFQLGGEMPLCTEDFLDVYIDVASSTLDTDRENAVLSHMASGEPPTTTPFSAAVYSSVLDRSALLGRYCGNYLADSRLQFVSLHREIVLDFYANLESISKQWAYSGYSALGFEGTYEFVSDTTFYPGRALTHAELSSISTERQTAACRFRVDVTSGAQISGRGGGDLSDSLPGVTGELISPTYPGYHPDGLHCAYQLVGLPSQRVNLDILDLDLPEVANVCSSDYLLFYDGLTPDPTTPVIGSRFCGTNKRIRVVSSGPNLLILFVTGTSVSSSTGGQSLVQCQSSTRRGFRLEYTFSAALLPVDPTQESQHIRGTDEPSFAYLSLIMLNQWQSLIKNSIIADLWEQN
ncbi:bone morphogenetic protein 1 [Clonorchis sinensis]|uniref:Bone morphogenetic protein 1 n=1 Tax=Clonorchis sinensis TaxID=79923 RepID=G7YCN6_CLOSI|nr:bone morphogenetic protein 1 [Clonorchis sinensis]